jgi:hypothetical protein
MRSRSSTLPLALLLLATLCSGCDDKEKPPFVPRDIGWKTDGRQQFMEICQQDADCASGFCLPMASATDKHCSRSCDTSHPCPALGGWSCAATQACVCKFIGAQPDVCNVDGDCDGKADKTPTLEVCNAKDDDCDGKTDNVAPGTPGAKQFFRDADGDGYGNPDDYVWACTAPDGYVDSKTDCDDKRKDVNPAQPEVCGDDVDHNCNGYAWDPEICGYLPIVVADVNDPTALASSLKSCGSNAGVPPSLDIVELIAKQDTTSVKFTVRLAGLPAVSSCSSYILRLGTFAKVYEMLYIYRPGFANCSGGLPELEAYLKGTPVTTKATVSFNAAAPGHVAFTIPKAEYLPTLSTPTYYLKACSNEIADATKDKTDCSSDSCETPVRRQ